MIGCLIMNAQENSALQESLKRLHGIMGNLKSSLAMVHQHCKKLITQLTASPEKEYSPALWRANAEENKIYPIRKYENKITYSSFDKEEDINGLAKHVDTLIRGVWGNGVSQQDYGESFKAVTSFFNEIKPEHLERIIALTRNLQKPDYVCYFDKDIISDQNISKNAATYVVVVDLLTVLFQVNDLLKHRNPALDHEVNYLLLISSQWFRMLLLTEVLALIGFKKIAIDIIIRMSDHEEMIASITDKKKSLFGPNAYVTKKKADVKYEVYKGKDEYEKNVKEKKAYHAFWLADTPCTELFSVNAGNIMWFTTWDAQGKFLVVKYSDKMLLLGKDVDESLSKSILNKWKEFFKDYIEVKDKFFTPEGDCKNQWETFRNAIKEHIYLKGLIAYGTGYCVETFFKRLIADHSYDSSKSVAYEIWNEDGDGVFLSYKIIKHQDNYPSLDYRIQNHGYTLVDTYDYNVMGASK